MILGKSHDRVILNIKAGAISPRTISTFRTYLYHSKWYASSWKCVAIICITNKGIYITAIILFYITTSYAQKAYSNYRKYPPKTFLSFHLIYFLNSDFIKSVLCPQCLLGSFPNSRVKSPPCMISSFKTLPFKIAF